MNLFKSRLSFLIIISLLLLSISSPCIAESGTGASGDTLVKTGKEGYSPFSLQTGSYRFTVFDGGGNKLFCRDILNESIYDLVTDSGKYVYVKGQAQQEEKQSIDGKEISSTKGDNIMPVRKIQGSQVSYNPPSDGKVKLIDNTLLYFMGAANVLKPDLSWGIIRVPNGYKTDSFGKWAVVNNKFSSSLEKICEDDNYLVLV